MFSELIDKAVDAWQNGLNYRQKHVKIQGMIWSFNG
jgi:hypothetical protein